MHPSNAKSANLSTDLYFQKNFIAVLTVRIKQLQIAIPDLIQENRNRKKPKSSSLSDDQSLVKR